MSPLALLGFVTMALILFLIMSGRTSPLVALIAVPLVTGIASYAFIGGDGGFLAHLRSLSDMITGADGIGSVANTGVMFLFSILFFGVLTDAGTFRPIIAGLIGRMGTHPVKIAIGTALLAMCVHLDGSGAVTFLICIPPLAPLYDAVGMRRTTLATIVALSVGVVNIFPWEGPALRAATVLGVDVVSQLFLPVLPAVLVGLLSVLLIAGLLGRAEMARQTSLPSQDVPLLMPLSPEDEILLRPQHFPINVALIVAAILTLLFSGLAPTVVFMVFYVLASLINYPKVADATARVNAHAKTCILMCSVLFAAGCFTGIMQGTGMIAQMAIALTALIPRALGGLFPLIVGVISMPASLLFDPDSFYYGVLPILAETAQTLGVSGVDVGRAAILGQMTTGFPVSPLTASTFLLVGLTGVDLGTHQRKTIPLAFLLTLIMLATAILTGGIALS